MLLPLSKQVSVPWNHQAAGSKQTEGGTSSQAGCLNCGNLGSSLLQGLEVLRASGKDSEGSQMKKLLRVNRLKDSHRGSCSLSWTYPWKQGRKSCRVSVWACHAPLFLLGIHCWLLSDTEGCAKCYSWSTVAFFMSLTILLYGIFVLVLYLGKMGTSCTIFTIVKWTQFLCLDVTARDISVPAHGVWIEQLNQQSLCK